MFLQSADGWIDRQWMCSSALEDIYGLCYSMLIRHDCDMLLMASLVATYAVYTTCCTPCKLQLAQLSASATRP